MCAGRNQAKVKEQVFTMRQEVVLPWRDVGCEYRRKHFEYLCDYYGQDFDIVIGDNEGEFNRSGARNAGVNNISSEVAIVIDADNFIPLDQIHLGVRYARRRKGLVKPFKSFGYLTEEATDLFYKGNKIVSVENMWMNPPAIDFSGGAYILRTEVWHELGGFDEGFTGYGAEDDAFHALCTSKIGRVSFVPGNNYHLYHPAYRVTSLENYQRLVSQYNMNKSRVHKIIKDLS